MPAAAVRLDPQGSASGFAISFNYLVEGQLVSSEWLFGLSEPKCAEPAAAEVAAATVVEASLPSWVYQDMRTRAGLKAQALAPKPVDPIEPEPPPAAAAPEAADTGPLDALAAALATLPQPHQYRAVKRAIPSQESGAEETAAAAEAEAAEEGAPTDAPAAAPAPPPRTKEERAAERKKRLSQMRRAAAEGPGGSSCAGSITRWASALLRRGSSKRDEPTAATGTAAASATDGAAAAAGGGGGGGGGGAGMAGRRLRPLVPDADEPDFSMTPQTSDAGKARGSARLNPVAYFVRQKLSSARDRHDAPPRSKSASSLAPMPEDAPPPQQRRGRALGRVASAPSRFCRSHFRRKRTLRNIERVDMEAGAETDTQPGGPSGGGVSASGRSRSTLSTGSVAQASHRPSLHF